MKSRLLISMTFSIIDGAFAHVYMRARVFVCCFQRYCFNCSFFLFSIRSFFVFTKVLFHDARLEPLRTLLKDWSAGVQCIPWCTQHTIGSKENDPKWPVFCYHQVCRLWSCKGLKNSVRSGSQSAPLQVWGQDWSGERKWMKVMNERGEDWRGGDCAIYWNWCSLKAAALCESKAGEWQWFLEHIAWIWSEA